MDFSKFKDINNVKKEALAVWEAIKVEADQLKNVNGEKIQAGFNRYVVEYLKNDYAKFDGRVSRRQYWMFFLYAMLIGIILSVFPLLLKIYFLAILVPFVGLCIRRVHDLNLSGLYSLVILIPFAGFILFCLPGDNKANNYGPAIK